MVSTGSWLPGLIDAPLVPPASDPRLPPVTSHWQIYGQRLCYSFRELGVGWGGGGGGWVKGWWGGVVKGRPECQRWQEERIMYYFSSNDTNRFCLCSATRYAYGLVSMTWNVDRKLVLEHTWVSMTGRRRVYGIIFWQGSEAMLLTMSLLVPSWRHCPQFQLRLKEQRERLLCEHSHSPCYTAFGGSTIPHSILYSVLCVTNPTFHTIQRLVCQQSHILYYTAFGVSTVPHSILYSVLCVTNPTFHTIQRLMCEQSNISYYTAFDVSPIPHSIL